MRHPAEGTLRRLVDEPVGVTEADRRHVMDCRECLARLATVQDDARTVDQVLQVSTHPDVDAAWRRLSAVTHADSRTRATNRSTRWRALRKPAVAALGAAVLLGGATAAAAADWLPIFHTEEIAPISITEADLTALPDLSAYGDLEIANGPEVRQVADAAAAEEATGLSVPQIGVLPRGVAGAPTYEVGDQVTAVFRFSSERLEATAAAAGVQLPYRPGFTGSEIELAAGPGVAAVWLSEQGVPALVVARAVAPTAHSSSDVSFEEIRDYLLDVPGLVPAELAAQLRSFSADGTTLPLPLPADLVTAEPTEVDGLPATLIMSRDGLLAGVVWVDDGVVTAVAGSLSADEVLSVAEDLR